MRKFPLSVIAIAALWGASALAADMPVKAPPAAVAVPMSNWSGLYVGVEGGWARGSTAIEGFFGPGPITTPRLHDSGGIAGGALGYNWQSGAFVFGVEGDASWADIDPRGQNATVFPTCTAGGLGVCGAKLGFLGTARGRAGFTLGNNILVYGTGGAAFGDIKTSVTNAAGSFADSETKSGWTAGGGIEAMLGSNWSLKVEYLFVDLGNGKTFPTTGGNSARFVEWKTDIVRVGLNYKFGGDPWGRSY